jgi:hypothetical protein
MSSWKIAQATGQWKLTNARRLREAQARFDAAEFERHMSAPAGLSDPHPARIADQRADRLLHRL